MPVAVSICYGFGSQDRGCLTYLSKYLHISPYFLKFADGYQVERYDQHDKHT